MGSADVDADLERYLGALGGRLVWRFHAFGADVAAVRLVDDDGTGADEGFPLVLLADHRPAGTTLPIWAVDDLDAAVARAITAGWAPTNRVEVPDGPVAMFRDPSGNEVALLERVRPDAMPSAYADPANERAVRDRLTG